MLYLNDFLRMTPDQEAELLTKNYFALEDSYDRYRAMCAVLALGEEEDGEDE